MSYRYSGRVKGILVRSWMDTWETERGTEELASILAELPSPLRVECIRGLFESAWYPQDLMVGISQGIWERVGDQGCVQMGFHAQRQSMARLAKLIARAAEPKCLLERTPKGWRIYQDTGRVRMIRLDGNEAVISVEEQPALLEHGYAEAMLGSMMALVQAAGGRDVGGITERQPPDKTVLHLAWNN